MKKKEQEGGEGEDTEELVRFRSVCVFDVAQTEGRPLPEFAQARGEPGEYTDRLMALAASRGIEVEFSDALVSAHGLSAGGKILVTRHEAGLVTAGGRARKRASMVSPMPRERAEANRMSIGEELRKLGYKLEYEYGHGEDRTEVWINEKLGMAVRIEWMTVHGEGKGRDF